MALIVCVKKPVTVWSKKIILVSSYRPNPIVLQFNKILQSSELKGFQNEKFKMQFFGIRLFTTWVVSCCCGNSSKTVKSTTLITYYGRLTKQTRTAASSNLVFNFFKRRRRKEKLAKSLLSKMVSLIDTARLCHFLKRKYLITVSWSANLCIPYILLHTWLANIFLMILFFTSSLATNIRQKDCNLYLW